MQEGKHEFRSGMHDGIPIALGYFTVSVSLGIAARNAGLTPFEGGLMSLTNMTSAGQFAGMTVIAAASGYLVMALMQLVINARYLLMSCSLSQRLDAGVPLSRRLLLGLCVTDEIFGISIARPGRTLSPLYPLGAFSVACPGWTLGTICGAIMGNVLPERLVSALSVALFGMLIAVFVPPCQKNRVVAVAVLCGMASSFLCTLIPLIRDLSEGTRLIVLTVLISLIAARLFPIKEDTADAA